MKTKESVLTSEARAGFTGIEIHSRCQVCECCASSYEGKTTSARFAATMGHNSENRCASSDISHRGKNYSQTSIDTQSVDR